MGGQLQVYLISNPPQKLYKALKIYLEIVGGSRDVDPVWSYADPDQGQ